jgi:hypothetical protein
MKSSLSNLLRYRRLFVAVALLVTITAIGFKGWRLFVRGQELVTSLSQLEAQLGADWSVQSWPALCTQLNETTNAVAAFRNEAGPLLWLTPYLGWVPSYGPDLTAAPPLLDAAGELSSAAALTCNELAILTGERAPGQPASVALTARLVAARPQFLAARQALDRGVTALDQIPLDQLSPAFSDRLRRVNELLPLARDGLDLALAAPDLLGADGPRDYLVVAQNPDELRATGGFISAAGLLWVDRGQVISFTMEDSTRIDNLAAAPYPLAPEPMRRYMLTEPMAPALWVFRDANWSPDFPTAAQAMLDFYQLGKGQSATGVIAFNPGAIQMLLAVLGPVAVEGVSQPVSAENVVDYMHTAWTDAVQQGRSTARKDFLNYLGDALLQRLEQSSDLDIVSVARAFQSALDQREIAVFVPDHEVAAILARRDWDGAVRPADRDFLMVVSANIGYNKVNPSIRQQINYAVNLSNPAEPRGSATVIHTNLSQGESDCTPVSRRTTPSIDNYADLTVDCYWNYLRVLTPGDTFLDDFAAPIVSDEWMISGDGDQGKIYSAKGEAGAKVYSALLVVPRATEHQVTFRYYLPPTVIEQDGHVWRYRLRLQKQPGQEQRAVVQILLPPMAALVATSPQVASYANQIVTFELTLNTDQAIHVAFQTSP